MFKAIGAAMLIAATFATKCGTPVPTCGGHEQDDCCTVIRVPDVPRTPDQVCVQEPCYHTPNIPTPTVCIPGAPSTPVICGPGRPDVPVICTPQVPQTPTKPTLPAPCNNGICAGNGGCCSNGGCFPTQGGCFPTKPTPPAPCSTGSCGGHGGQHGGCFPTQGGCFPTKPIVKPSRC